MKNPGKKFSDAHKYYNSLALVLFQLNHESGNYERQLSSGISPQFDKDRKVEYPTDLYLNGEVLDLADRMIKRFGIMSETLPISSGKSLIEVDLLDQIELDVNINGRQFSNKLDWIAREVDPGQDTLVIEAKSGFVEAKIIDGILSQPMFINSTTYDGVLNQPLSVNGSNIYNGVLSQSITIIEEE